MTRQLQTVKITFQALRTSYSITYLTTIAVFNWFLLITYILLWSNITTKIKFSLKYYLYIFYIPAKNFKNNIWYMYNVHHHLALKKKLLLTCVIFTKEFMIIICLIIMYTFFNVYLRFNFNYLLFYFNWHVCSMHFVLNIYCILSVIFSLF